MITIAFFIVVLLCLSALFSGSETALTGASKARMHTLEKNGNKHAGKVNKLLSARENMLSALLIGNNLVNILASSLATALMITLFGESGVFAATLAMTILVVIFAEILPKTYAIRHAETLSLKVAPFMRLLVFVLTPISWIIQKFVAGIFWLFGIGRRQVTDTHAEEELRGAIDLHAKQKTPKVRQARDMLKSILDLNQVEVGEIMTHRSNVTMLNVDAPPRDILAKLIESPYTRIPLWRDNPDNIIGVIHAKAVLRTLFRNRQNTKGVLEKDKLASLARSPWFIPESTKLLDQLQAFRTRHEHFALVIDEYGILLGIVTLEDILEEIVGDITDEHDVASENAIAGVKPLENGSFRINGQVTIRDLNRKFDWRLPDDHASTIAGLVLHLARKIPNEGEVFHCENLSIEILKRKKYQITSVKVWETHGR